MNTTIREGAGNRARLRWALGITVALLLQGVVACTDPTVAPKSSVSDANFFNDTSSYKAFLAKIYAGLALSGQQGPAGQPDIRGIDEGFSQYLRLYWEHEELPTDEAVTAWGDIGLPEWNTQAWKTSRRVGEARYYRSFFHARLPNEVLLPT